MKRSLRVIFGVLLLSSASVAIADPIETTVGPFDDEATCAAVASDPELTTVLLDSICSSQDGSVSYGECTQGGDGWSLSASVSCN